MNIILSVMDMSQAQAWVLVIAAFGTMVTSVIAAVYSVKSSTKADASGVKLDKIHKDTNGSLHSIRKQVTSLEKQLKVEKAKSKPSVKRPKKGPSNG